MQLQRSNQSEIQQALLQQIPAEALFKQYKIATAADAQGGKGVQKGVPVMEGLTRDMIAVAEQAVNTAPRVPTQVNSLIIVYCDYFLVLLYSTSVKNV